MFDQYGPNSLKVEAFVRALKNMPADEFSLVGPRTMDWDRLDSLLKKVTGLEKKRIEERARAFHNAGEAVRGRASETQAKVVAGVAAILVIEDILTIDERTFLSLFLLHPFVPLKFLYEDFKKEDRAVEDFCEQLSLIDGQAVYVKSRPDERGRAGAGLPDFIISRAGKDFIVEHTSVDTYPNQVHFEKLWAKYFKPLNIEERVKQAFPKSFIHITIPIDALKSDREARGFDFERFVQDLIEAIKKTPKGRNGSERRTYNMPFPVNISNDDGNGFVGCFVIQLVPTHPEKRDNDLEKEMAKAIKKKRKKLKAAKEHGESTILLLDSDDYALVNEEILADAFARAVNSEPSMLEGIDELYIQHRRGKTWIVPVKIGEQVYPNLPAFEEYLHQQFEML